MSYHLFNRQKILQKARKKKHIQKKKLLSIIHKIKGKELL